MPLEKPEELKKIDGALAEAQQETAGDYEKERGELEARLAEIHKQYEELFAIRTDVFGEFAKGGALKPPSNNYERYFPDEIRAHRQVFDNAYDKVKLARKEGKEASLTDLERIAYELQVKFNEFDLEREKIAAKLKDLEGKSKSRVTEQAAVNERVPEETSSEQSFEQNQNDELKRKEILERIKSM